ncbi:g4772 [Coccomyxa elongata]
MSQGAVTWAEDSAPLEQKQAEESPAKNADLDSITKLLIWIQQNEGQVDLEVGAVNEAGLRGTKAMRDMQQYQVAVKLKKYMAVPLGEWNKSSEENALVLLKKRFKEPEWDKVMQTYWDSLPQRDEIITKETFPPAKLGLLQDPSMAAFVRIHQDFTRNVLRGAKPHIVKDVRAMLGRDISLEEFKYWTAMVASYAFTFPDDTDPEKQVRVMLPLVDLINHGNRDEANVKLFRDENGDYIAYATRVIKKGEELRHTYQAGCERNDHALFHYGFVQDLPEPKLAAQDLPSGNLYDDSAHSEADYDVGGPLATEEELQRLKDILAAFPTTEAEDERLLTGGGWMDKLLGRKPLTDSVERLFVTYRMLRKKALRLTIERLRANLASSSAEL